jgi:hypothetical protein
MSWLQNTLMKFQRKKSRPSRWNRWGFRNRPSTRIVENQKAATTNPMILVTDPRPDAETPSSQGNVKIKTRDKT